MKQRALLKALLSCVLMAVVVGVGPVSAQSSSSGRGGWRLYGDWQVKMEFNGREVESILSFSRDDQGKWTGSWISFWGLSELKDIKFQDGQLTFVWTGRNRQGESTTSKFTGTVKDGKLSGSLSSDRGQLKIEGQRAPRIPRAVGTWETKTKVGQREYEGTLIITADKDGRLTAKWQSQRVKHEITDVRYERGKLTFKRTSTMDDRRWESTFEGTVRGNTLTGAMKSQRGEMAVEGKRKNGSLVGTWMLEITSERGTVKQRLKVNPDMTGLYGSLTVKKINLEGDKVSFGIVLEFGERKFEMSFEGKIADSTLTGELKTSRGSRKVTGKKVVRTFRRRSAG